ncbi:MAG: hypothetical protein AAF517_21155 [Planctomycetota bacterium]
MPRFYLVSIAVLSLACTSCTFVKRGDGVARSVTGYDPKLTIEEIDDWLRRIDELEASGVSIREWMDRTKVYREIPNWWNASARDFGANTTRAEFRAALHWQGLRGNLYALRASAQVVHNPVEIGTWSLYRVGNELTYFPCTPFHIAAILFAPIELVIFPIRLSVQAVQDGSPCFTASLPPPPIIQLSISDAAPMD